MLRLWVVGSDYSEDLRIGPEILKQQADVYRRFRNTLRYLLGSLDGFDSRERLSVEEMPELDRWVLHGGASRRPIAASLRRPAVPSVLRRVAHLLRRRSLGLLFGYPQGFALLRFAGRDRRRAARTVLDVLFDCLTAWLAPFLCFTAEEAWLTRNPGPESSVHLDGCSPKFPRPGATTRSPSAGRRCRLRHVVTGALEVERAGSAVGSSLQAHPMIWAEPSYGRRPTASISPSSRSHPQPASPRARRRTMLSRWPRFRALPSRLSARRVRSATAAGRSLPMSAAIRGTRGCVAAAPMRSSDTERPPNDCSDDGRCCANSSPARSARTLDRERVGVRAAPRERRIAPLWRIPQS